MGENELKWYARNGVIDKAKSKGFLHSGNGNGIQRHDEDNSSQNGPNQFNQTVINNF